MSKRFLLYLLGVFLALAVGVAVTLEGGDKGANGFVFVMLVPVIGIAVVATIMLFAVLVIAVHEYGHVLVAQHYHFRINRIVVCGRAWSEPFPHREGPWSQSAFTFTGHVSLCPPDMIEYRRKMINMFWGGQVASIVLAITAAGAAYWGYVRTSPDGLLFGALATVFACSPIVSGFLNEKASLPGDFVRIRSLRGGKYPLQTFAYLELYNYFEHSKGLHEIPESFFLTALEGRSLEPEECTGFVLNWYSYWLQCQGRFRESLAPLEESLPLLAEDNNIDGMLDLCFIQALVGDISEAERLLEENPADQADEPHSYPLAESAIAFRKGDHALALTKLEEAAVAREKGLPPDHPHHQTSLVRFAKIRELYDNSASGEDAGAKADA